MFVDHPGISIVAIDPGTTTGVAVYDAFTQQLYVDQIDAGRGRKSRNHVWPNKTESLRRERAVKQIEAERGLKPSKNLKNSETPTMGQLAGEGKLTEMQILDVVEFGMITVLTDLIRAVGPMSVVIIEDFVLGWGDPGRAKSSKRDGLSPVRIGTRLHDRMVLGGFMNGDAWRDWDGFGATGKDGRGVKLSRRQEGIMPYLDRLSDVERWRLGEPLATEPDDAAVRGLWAGGGCKFIRQMPGQRLWLQGGEKAVVAWMKEHGYWKTSAPHGMDALMHMLVWARKVGAGIPNNQKRIWEGNETLRGNRVSSKAIFQAG